MILFVLFLIAYSYAGCPEGCKCADGGEQCMACNDGFINTATTDGQFDCKPCGVDDCKTCTYRKEEKKEECGFKCTQCNDGYKLDSYGYCVEQCLVDVPHCSTCDSTNKAKCAECSSHYKFNDGKCSECDTGYKQGSDGRCTEQCYVDVPNCYRCDSTNKATCAECDSHYTLDANGQCSECKDGYVKDSDGDCVEKCRLDPNCYHCDSADSTKCRECYSGYKFDTYGKCSECNTGYEKVDGNCVEKCIVKDKNCENCDSPNRDTCEECINGATLKNGKCVVDEGVEMLECKYNNIAINYCKVYNEGTCRESSYKYEKDGSKYMRCDYSDTNCTKDKTCEDETSEFIKDYGCPTIENPSENPSDNGIAIMTTLMIIGIVMII